jgi:predicted TIM-barrel fold metal-dependent hydrolase
MPNFVLPDDLIAIDMHVHPWDVESLGPMSPERVAAMSKHFGRDLSPVPLPELADYYRERRMMAVLLATDDSTTSGLPPVSNDHIAKAARENPDAFIAFAGIDPWKGKLAVDEARRAKEELGVAGLKFNPGRQHFFPDDPRFGKLWDACAELDLICLFHTGMLGNGSGTRGGLGFKLKYVRPIPHLDDIAADHPDLTIISAHPAWPWQAEQLAMARHKANVYIDLSGWSPKLFDPQLIRDMNGRLQNRILFGSDWPVLTSDRWLAEFAELDIKPEVRQKVLIGNARRLFSGEDRT